MYIHIYMHLFYFCIYKFIEREDFKFESLFYIVLFFLNELV